jgi:hypothetical protein
VYDDDLFCAVCQGYDRRKNADAFHELPCNHSFHHSCLMRWLHQNHPLCPVCRADIDLSPFAHGLWRIENLAIATLPSPESVALGLRPTGWANVQLRVFAPPDVSVKHVRYIFHPAFNVSRLTVTLPPFDLVIKLCSANVEVVVEACYTSKEAPDAEPRFFRMCHTLEKDGFCSRLFFQGPRGQEFNGSEKPSDEVVSEEYFHELLRAYRRPSDYYLRSPDEPRRISPLVPPVDARMQQAPGFMSRILRHFRS